jgi:NAD(P)-dependent dehydrogenase (short-subunit alcohol dehydrogenase family)
MDVLSNESISQCVEYIEAVLEDAPNKPLLAVVNNAGFCMIAPFELTPDEDIKRAFDLDLFAYFAVIRAFLPILKQNKGRIINVGSFGGYANVPMWSVYCAIKAAIENFGRVLRFEMMPFGVGMCSQYPGINSSEPSL